MYLISFVSSNNVRDLGRIHLIVNIIYTVIFERIARVVSSILIDDFILVNYLIILLKCLKNENKSVPHAWSRAQK